MREIYRYYSSLEESNSALGSLAKRNFMKYEAKLLHIVSDICEVEIDIIIKAVINF